MKIPLTLAVALSLAGAVHAQKTADIESRPLGALTATPAEAAKPVSPETLVPGIALNLALVVGLMVAGAFAWKTLKRGPRRAKNALESESGLPARLEIADQLRLAGGQTLYSVRQGGRTFLIGATPQNLSLLADLSAPLAASPAPSTVAEPRRPKPVEPLEENRDRFSGILDRLRAQESAEPVAPARRSLFDGGSR